MINILLIGSRKCPACLLLSESYPYCKVQFTSHLFSSADTFHGFLSTVPFLELWIQLISGPRPTAVFLICPVVRFSTHQYLQKTAGGLQCGLTAIRGHALLDPGVYEALPTHFNKLHAPVPC